MMQADEGSDRQVRSSGKLRGKFAPLSFQTKPHACMLVATFNYGDTGMGSQTLAGIGSHTSLPRLRVSSQCSKRTRCVTR